MNTCTNIVNGLKRYWNRRSHTYSESNIEELGNFKGYAWTKLLLENAPKKDTLRVLDVGTGPGLFSILMATQGHIVTGVDVTPEMLKHAKENAENYGVEVNYIKIDDYRLPFDDNSFDLVISRNVLWNIAHPKEALKEWYRVLDTNGRIVYFDANWYLYLYDENQNKKVQEARNKTEELYGEKFEHTVQTKFLEDLALNLKLSKVHRPEWDKEAVKECNFKLIKVNEDIGDLVLDEKQKLKESATPMFMIVAQK